MDEIGPKIKNAADLLKFGTFDVPNIPISIIFIRYLSPVLAQTGLKIKSAQKLLKFGTSDISNMPISILMSKMIFIEYLPSVRHMFVPKLKVPRSY